MNYAVLASAISKGEPEDVGDGSLRVHRFEQKVPVVSYLVAIVAAVLQSAVIGPRSKVWAERPQLEDAIFDFADTEKMIQAAESLVGP